MDWLVGLESLSPLRLAGKWDNVGLLLEGTRPVRRVGLCIDLTEPVLSELLTHDVDAVISYHPPLFSGVKRLTEAAPRDRTLLRLVREGVHLFSPHSALDAAAGGMAEWLLKPLGALEAVEPIAPDVLDPSLGAGRKANLDKSLRFADIWPRVCRHLGLEHVRIAGDEAAFVNTVAVCPGSGGSLFESVQADLLVTGEMRHHDVLAQVERGGVVVLTDHTNTERGYLQIYAQNVARVCGVEVVISQLDADPLRVVRG